MDTIYTLLLITTIGLAGPILGIVIALLCGAAMYVGHALVTWPATLVGLGILFFKEVRLHLRRLPLV